MNLNVTFKNFESSESIKRFISEKFKKVQKYFTKPLDVSVVLTKEKINNIVDVTLSTKGFLHKFREVNEDMYGALDLVYDAMERQLKRHKEKIKDYKSREGVKELSEIIYNEDSPSQIKFKSDQNLATDPKVIKTEDYPYRLLTLNEAIEQLDQSNFRFLLFNEEQTKHFFLLAQRDDGYDLIEPRYNLSSKERKDLETASINGLRLNRDYIVRSQSPDEAIIDLDKNDQNFAVFSNPQTDTLNVLYRKTIGVYGLIETQQ